MRELIGRTVTAGRVTVRQFGARVSSAQGVLGAGFVVTGVSMLAGAGWGWISAGCFLIFGAWAAR